jgi:hypothetical protein
MTDENRVPKIQCTSSVATQHVFSFNIVESNAKLGSHTKFFAFITYQNSILRNLTDCC